MEDQEPNNVTEMPTSEEDVRKLPLPVSPEDTQKYFGINTEAKQKVIDSTLSVLETACGNNPMLVTEILQHMNGLWMQKCIAAQNSFPAHVYAKVIVNNAAIWTGTCMDAMGEDIKKMNQALTQALASVQTASDPAPRHGEAPENFPGQESS